MMPPGQKRQVWRTCSKALELTLPRPSTQRWRRVWAWTTWDVTRVLRLQTLERINSPAFFRHISEVCSQTLGLAPLDLVLTAVQTQLGRTCRSQVQTQV